MSVDFFGIKKFAYASFATGVLLFLIVFLTSFSLPFLFLSLLLIFSTAVILKVGDWVIPSLLYRLRIHPLFANMEVTDEAIVVKAEDRYFAAGGAELLITRSIAELREEERTTLARSWHSFLSAVRFPFRIIVINTPVDIAKEFGDVLREIEKAKVRIAEAKKNDDRYTEITYEKKLAEFEKIAARFKAETPYDTVFLMATHGEGYSREEAVKALQERLGELTTAIAVSLNVEARKLSGVELLKLLELHLFTPASLEDYLF